MSVTYELRLVKCSATLLVSLAGLLGCAGAEDAITKEEARLRLDPVAPGEDVCESRGWYGDGECDSFCAERDSVDCTHCPDRTDPSVRYVSTDPNSCRRARFTCAVGEIPFSNDCGCGCLGEAPQADDREPSEPRPRPEPTREDGGDEGRCPNAARDDVNYLSTDPDLCARVLFTCAAPQQPFSNECGCGCTGARETLSIAECEARGGTVIGDPGDGSTRDPAFLCPSAEPPIANVSFGREGGVCCAL